LKKTLKDKSNGSLKKNIRTKNIRTD